MPGLNRASDPHTRHVSEDSGSLRATSSSCHAILDAIEEVILRSHDLVLCDDEISRSALKFEEGIRSLGARSTTPTYLREHLALPLSPSMARALGAEMARLERKEWDRAATRRRFHDAVCTLWDALLEESLEHPTCSGYRVNQVLKPFIDPNGKASAHSVRWRDAFGEMVHYDPPCTHVLVPEIALDLLVRSFVVRRTWLGYLRHLTAAFKMGGKRQCDDQVIGAEHLPAIVDLVRTWFEPFTEDCYLEIVSANAIGVRFHGLLEHLPRIRSRLAIELRFAEAIANPTTEGAARVAHGKDGAIQPAPTQGATKRSAKTRDLTRDNLLNHLTRILADVRRDSLDDFGREFGVSRRTIQRRIGEYKEVRDVWNAVLRNRRLGKTVRRPTGPSNASQWDPAERETRTTDPDNSSQRFPESRSPDERPIDRD